MNQPKRLRRPVAGGYARGDETRLRIMEAAIDLFGEYGFDGASTRDIAARAGVNAPALQYYFENKEGVLRACAEHMADDAWSSFEPVVAHAHVLLNSNAETPELIDGFLRILETVADRTLAKSCEPNQRLFFAREQAGHLPSMASEIITQRVRHPLNEVSAQLVARITGTTPEDPITRIRTLSLYGQLLIFHVAQRTSFTMLDWTEIDAEKGDMLKAAMRAQSRILLEHWHREHMAREAAAHAPHPVQTHAVRKGSAASGAKSRVARPA